MLLPYRHRFSRLFAEYTHKEGGHLGVAATVSKIRLRVWIPRIIKMVKSIRFHCVKGLNVEDISQFGIDKCLEWKFSPADGPWQNGCPEALVKSVKKAIAGSVGSQVLTVPEIQTVFFEAANLVNERPIGRHPTDPNDGDLYPNHLLLGRASSIVPSGPFENLSKSSQRFSVIHNIINSFWRQWTRDFFPSLLGNQKCHTEKRNVKIGDVVIVQDSKQIRGNWRLASVSNVLSSDDGWVRRVELQYKNEKPGEAMNKYAGSPYTKIERSVQRIVVIVPIDKDETHVEVQVAGMFHYEFVWAEAILLYIVI